MKLLKYFDGRIDSSKVFDFAKKFGIGELVMKLIVSRGYDTEEKISEFLSPSISRNAFDLKGMRELVERVMLAKERGEKILVFGDYDVDGVSATAIMIKALKKLGLEPEYYLPNRFVDGYGLTREVIDKIVKKFNPNLIITVDCGISCHDEIEYAKSLGVEVIVTDHHELPDVLPETVTINAKIEGQAYGFRELCGTGVAYKVAEALIGKEAEEFLPIAAIATIADIVSLRDENRTIVYRGIKLLDKYLPAGLKALFRAQRLDLKSVTSTDISFKIAPKLNASGRMGDADDSLKLYIETDPVEIRKYLNKINSHNEKRQELCNSIYADCKAMLSKHNMSQNRAIVLSSPNWDQGILGIVSARLVEEYNRPVFLFANLGEESKGSARSIKDINVHLLLNSMDELLETYGGHPVAAGLTIKTDRLQEFKVRVEEYIAKNINDFAFVPVQYYDEKIELKDINKKLLDDISKLEPFGTDNQSPRFLVTTSFSRVVPMKNCPQHANIFLSEKFPVVEFSYYKDFEKIKHSKLKNFIFELQHDNFSRSIKGLCKANSFSFEVSPDKVLNFGNLYQLAYDEVGESRYAFYTDEELLKLVANPSCFGTCFVATNLRDYNSFLESYNTENIVTNSIFGGSEQNGFNTVFLCPERLDFVKHYENIVFLSPVINKGYLTAINNLSDAKVYLPLNKSASFNPQLDLSRGKLGEIYSALRGFRGGFVSIDDLYSKLKISSSYENFVVAIKVFEELKILSYNILNEIKYIEIHDEKKVELKNSKFYNLANLLKSVKEAQ